MTGQTAYQNLLARSQEIALIDGAGHLLSWDQETYMPPQALAFRADQLAYFSGCTHRLFTAPEVGDWIKACEDFGFRRQYSVFLCRLSAHDLVRLKSRLYDEINLLEDQVLFIPLCNRCAERIEALGRPVEKYDARDVVIVT